MIYCPILIKLPTPLIIEQIWRPFQRRIEVVMNNVLQGPVPADDIFIENPLSVECQWKLVSTSENVRVCVCREDVLDICRKSYECLGNSVKKEGPILLSQFFLLISSRHGCLSKHLRLFLICFLAFSVQKQQNKEFTVPLSSWPSSKLLVSSNGLSAVSC